MHKCFPLGVFFNGHTQPLLKRQNVACIQFMSKHQRLRGGKCRSPLFCITQDKGCALVVSVQLGAVLVNPPQIPQRDIRQTSLCRVRAAIAGWTAHQASNPKREEWIDPAVNINIPSVLQRELHYIEVPSGLVLVSVVNFRNPAPITAFQIVLEGKKIFRAGDSLTHHFHRQKVFLGHIVQKLLKPRDLTGRAGKQHPFPSL